MDLNDKQEEKEMALIKEIILKNGIPVNYHRIVSVNNITNSESIIEIGRYISKAKREEEKQALLNGDSMDIFIDTDYKNVPYDKNLNVDTAYELLKTDEDYLGAEDDL